MESMDRWNAMQWSAMEWIDGMQCSGVEWNGVDGCSGWMIRTPNVHEQIDFGFFGQSDNFHFSKVAHFFSFCEARSKIVSKKRRAAKLAFLKNEFLLRFCCVFLCVFTVVFKWFLGAWDHWAVPWGWSWMFTKIELASFAETMNESVFGRPFHITQNKNGK